MRCSVCGEDWRPVEQEVELLESLAQVCHECGELVTPLPLPSPLVGLLWVCKCGHGWGGMVV